MNAATKDNFRWLPTSVREVRERGWDQLDIILFSGDAYVDHPSFGPAVVGRMLEAEGYRVAIVPQPNWQDDLRDFRKLGPPRMFFGVTAGNMDSMVNHYTANKRLRSDDAYTPGGKAGFRPDYAVTVYTRILKRLYPHIPVVAGGIEASLRRLAHYDYWSDTVKPSVLLDSGADLVIYGMADKVLAEVARAMKNGFNAKLLRGIRQVAFLADDAYAGRLPAERTLLLEPYAKTATDKSAFARNFTLIETESNRLEPDRTIVEEYPGGRFVVVNPPYARLTAEEIDRGFDLPYTRLPHPRSRGKGDIPAYEMIKHSVNIHRGCFGGCSFCTISAHQGKFVSSRSERSILEEVRKVAAMPDFKGYLSDVGGPSANMYGMRGRDESWCALCKRPSCLYPALCRNLDNSHAPLLDLYAKIRQVAGIKKAFIGSGIRYDLFDRRHGGRYLREVVVNHTSGRLKVAPEHTEERVLALMRKPQFSRFEELTRSFRKICETEGLKYRLIPYFISSHPGCTEDDMKALSDKTRRLDFRLEQVQDLTPTPMTLSSVMFHTGIDPYTGKKLFVARDQNDKRRQKSYFFGAPSAPGEPAPGRQPRKIPHASSGMASSGRPGKGNKTESAADPTTGNRPAQGRPGVNSGVNAPRADRKQAARGGKVRPVVRKSGRRK
ncbi:MAG: YgiQ family radical SAM protein [Alistipes sp.]|nr:YgiQ family radical SAM protein [Alistipes sp.]